MSSTTTRWRRRTAAAVAASALGLSALAITGTAHADTATTADGATATVADVVAIGNAIHIEGTGWTHPTNGTGSTIAVKLGGALNTEPASGPVTNPATGTSADDFDIWAAVEAEDDGTFSADIPFPTPANTSPALPSAWAVGSTHYLQLLTGVMESGDTGRGAQLTFTIGEGLVSTATTAANGQVTVAFSGGDFPVGEVLSVKKGDTPLQWTVRSGRTSTTQDTLTVGDAGTISASVVLAAGTAPAGGLTLTITGDQGTDQDVTVQVPPSVVFDNGTALGASGTLTLGNLVAGATISSVKLGDTTLASGLTADGDGDATAPYAIPRNIQPVATPLVITQAAPEARTYTLSQTVYPDETTAGAKRFGIVSSTETLYQGLYQSAYSKKEDALYATTSDRGTGNNGFIYKLDPNTLEVEASVDTTTSGTKTGAFGIGVDDVNGNVWVTNTGAGAVAVYKESDLSLVKQFPADTISHPRDVVYDPKTNQVFASSASEGSSASSTGYISVFEAADNDGDGTPYEKIKDVQTGTRDVFNPVSLALGNGKVFSPSLGSNKVAVIDTTTLEPTFIEIDGIDVGGRGASGIAYDAAGNRLFIASQNSNEVVIADATTGATIAEVPTGRQALNVAFDKVHGLAYVANFGGTSVTVLDRDGHRIASLPIATANHVSLDGEGNAFVVDKASSNKVWKITPRLETVGGVDLLDPTANGVTGKAATTPLEVSVTYGKPIHISGTNFLTADGTSGSRIGVKPADVQGSPTIATIDADSDGAWAADIPFPNGWKVGDSQNLRLLTGSLKDGDTIRSIAIRVSVLPAALATGTPVIAGTAKVGQRLTATPGAWTAGTRFAYQWKRNGAAIAGATAAAYTPVAADGGKRLTVTVTGTLDGHQTATATSAAVTVQALTRAEQKVAVAQAKVAKDQAKIKTIQVKIKTIKKSTLSKHQKAKQVKKLKKQLAKAKKQLKKDKKKLAKAKKGLKKSRR